MALHHLGFFYQIEWTATDIGSLAPVLDEHVDRLGIGRKGSLYNVGKASEFFLGALPLYCRFSSHCTAEHHYSLAHFPWTLQLTN
jgi:hypothetical protein